MLRTLCSVAALAVTATVASAGTVSGTYGWEDGGTVLGSFGNFNSSNYTAGDPGLVYSGNRSLFVFEEPIGSTPQGYVAFITGLSEGDVIDASFFAWDDTPGDSPSLRIWGHYAMSDDVNSYEGSAGGNNTFSGENVWTELSHSWTFSTNEDGRDALVIEVRIYAGDETTNFGYVDDLSVTVTGADVSGVEINFAPAPGALALLAAGGFAGSRRRRA